MSLLYRIFGIPKNSDEFIEKIKREGITNVNVSLGVMDEGLGGKYEIRISLQSGKYSFPVDKFAYHRTADLRDVIIGRAGVKQKGLKEAVMIAKRLQNSGLEVTIGKENNTIDETMKEVQDYEIKMKNIDKDLKAIFNINQHGHHPKDT